MEVAPPKRNPYMLAKRFSRLPIAECRGIAYSLENLIASSNDDDYIRDAKLRLEAVSQRIAA